MVKFTPLNSRRMRKRYLVFTLLSLALLGTAFTGRRTLTFLHTEEFIVDTAQSSIEWVGKKKIKQHYGNVKISRGSLQSNHGTLTGGDFEIDMQSISNLDIKDDKSRARLIKHLRSPDFFSVDSFPPLHCLSPALPPTAVRMIILIPLPAA